MIKVNVFNKISDVMIVDAFKNIFWRSKKTRVGCYIVQRNVGKCGICYDRVCLSVCLSHSWVTPKQFKSYCNMLLLCILRQHVISRLLRPNLSILNSGGSPRASALKTSIHIASEIKLRPIISNNLETMQDKMQVGIIDW